MNLLFPLEIRCDSKFHLDDASCYRLDICFKFESWELMDELMNDLAHLWKLHDLPYLLGRHIIEVLPGKLLLFLNLAQDLLRYSMILSEWCH